MEGGKSRNDSCLEGFGSLEGPHNSHVDRSVSLGNRLGSVESSGGTSAPRSCDQMNRCWDHDYDWLLLDDDDSSVPETSRSSWGSTREWNALAGPSTQDLTKYEWMAYLLNLNNSVNGPSSLLLPGERGYGARLEASIRAHPRTASELAPTNYFQIDWSCTPTASASSRNDSARWIPFPRIRPFHPAPASSGEDRRQSSHRRRLISAIVDALLRCKFGDEDHMPNGELIDGFAELYRQNIDTRLDLGILDELNNAELREEFVGGSLKERKHRASQPVERCSICLEDYVDGEYIAKLECRHEFHPSCIKKWMLVKYRCPICNRQAMETDSSSDGDSSS